MPEESLKTVLGFEAKGAIRTINSLAKAINNYNMSLFRATIITQKYNQVARKVDAQFTKQSAAMKGAASAQSNLTAQSKRGNAALKEAGTQTETLSRQTKKLAKDVDKSGKQLILSWQSVIRIFTIQVIHQMISKITSSLSASAEAARKFEIGIAEIETIADTVGLNFDELADRALKAAIAIGQPLDVVVEAQYQLLSNQVGNATESFMAFEASQRLSLAAVTPLNDAVMLITGTLNAYGKSASEADTIAAKLFKTVELGRVRIAEMGDTLGRVTVLGAQLGISLDEILASIATLTIQGVKAADAMTQILNVQLKLIRPTDAMKVAFAELGVASAEVGIQAFGFQGFLQKLRETTDGTASSIGELFGRVRATRAELGLTGRATDKYRKNLEGIRAATSELLTEKLELIFKTNAKQVEIELNKLHIQITKNFGRSLNTLLKETFDLFGGASETMTTLGLASGAAAATFLILRSGILYTIPNLVGFSLASSVATKKLVLLRTASLSTALSIKAMTRATLAFLATPLGAAIAMAAAITAIALAYRQVEAATKKYFEELGEHQERSLERTLKNFKKEFSARKELLEKKISELQQNLTESVSLEREAAKKSTYIEEQLHDNIVNQIKNRTSAIESYAEGIENIIDGLNSKLKKLRDDSRSIQQTIEAFKFERELKGMEETEKFYSNIEKSEELRRKSRSAIQKGEIEIGKELGKQSEQYAKRALQIADTLEDSRKISNAEREVEAVLEGQLTNNKIIARQERVRTAQAEKASAGLFKQVNNLQRMTEEYKDLDDLISNLSSNDVKREGLIKRRLELAKEITTEFDKFAKRGKEAVALKLEEPFQQAIKALREPITGVKMDLSDIIIFDAIHIAKKLQPTLDEVGKKARLRIALDLGVIIGAPGELSKELLRSTEELEAQGKQQEKNLTALQATQNVYKTMRGNIMEVTKALRSQEAFTTRAARRIRTVGGALGVAEPLIAPEGPIGFDLAAQNITALAMATANLIKEGGNIEEITGKIAELVDIEANVTAEGLLEVSNKLKTVIDTLEGGRDALQILKDAADMDLSPIATQINSIGNAAKTETDKVKELNRVLRQLREFDVIGQVTVRGKSLGGMIYRQYGGFTPRGTDTIPAMLSPGEFVVNAESSKQFFSQLVAINAGVKPVYRQQGGSVTNVGDINITVQGSGTPQQTARETMFAFKREFRRRTASLN